MHVCVTNYLIICIVGLTPPPAQHRYGWITSPALNLMTLLTTVQSLQGSESTTAHTTKMLLSSVLEVSLHQVCIRYMYVCVCLLYHTCVRLIECFLEILPQRDLVLR